MKDIFPERYSVLLMGPPGVGKQYFCMDLAHYYLKKGEKVVFLTTENSPEEIEKTAAEIGLNLTEDKDSLYYLDCYSWSLRQTTPSTGGRRNVIRITNPESLNEIIVKLERAMGIIGGRVRMIAHSLSPFFLHNEEKDVIKFMQLLVSRLKEKNSFLLTALQEGVHSPSTVNTLRYLMDGTLEMRFHEGERLERHIRTHHLKDLPTDTRWMSFSVDKSGFKILR
jgi:KaiC/GvpD/RAD55 family RecA-like ATPase